MQVISFDVKASFAAFRDPSVTTNQTVYYIPSKSAIIGMLGAMLGVRRDNKLGDIYSKEYIDFFTNTIIGLCVNSDSMSKVILYTNHRSLKEIKTKPVKKELVENPSYTIYAVLEKSDELLNRLKTNEFVFTPYMGHAYCPAIITNPQVHDAVKSNNLIHETKCVVLDESEPFNTDFEFSCKEILPDMTIMIERHLHHYFENDIFQKKVMRHWIPLGGNIETNDYNSTRKISAFYDIDGEAVCLY